MDPVHSIFQYGLDFLVFTIMSLDSCGYDNAKFRFCRSCFYYIQELNIPKFGAINVVNVYPYQDYPYVI